MADTPNRDKLEADLARELARLGARALDKLIAQLGDPPDVGNVSAAFWREYGDDLRKVLQPFLAKVASARASAFASDVPKVEGVDWALANTTAANWADGYTFDLVTGINETTRDLIAGAVRQSIEQGLSRAELADLLAPTFGPVRAEMIAVTEVTRAVAEGEAAAVDELGKAGFEMVGEWQTANDEIVCPICQPLDGLRAVDGTFTHPETGDTYDLPPAHPRCRCTVGYTMVKA